MEIIIKSMEDQTPKGLSTGFRVMLGCSTAEGKPFALTAAILVSKDVLQKQIALENIVIAALKKSGLEDCAGELFVDSRRLDASALASTAPALPLTVTLGGADVLNAKAIAKLTETRN